MIKSCRFLILFYALYCLNCEVVFACFEFGKWYSSRAVDGPLLPGEIEPENRVRLGLEGKRNLLCKVCVGKRGVFYVNNFYPHADTDESIRQLGDILVRKELLSSEDLKRVKQICDNNVESSDPTKHIEALRNFISGVIAYLEAFKLNECAKRLIDVLMAYESDKKIEGINPWVLLEKLDKFLCDKKEMALIYDCMHTERLLVFDKYYDGATRTLKAPEKRLVFISHYDMCMSCEKLMVDMLKKMEDCPSGKFFRAPYGDANYKILVGSFFSYKDSRCRNQDSKLLKVPLKIEPFAKARKL